MLIRASSGSGGGGGGDLTYLIKKGIEERTATLTAWQGSFTKTQGADYIELTSPNAAGQNGVYYFDLSDFVGKSIILCANIAVSYIGNALYMGNGPMNPWSNLAKYTTVVGTDTVAAVGLDITATNHIVGFGQARSSWKVYDMFVVEV